MAVDSTAQTELLTLRRIEKRFPGMIALDGVNFTLKAGEIHALMGENGAGKSTLIKVLTGVLPLDGGEILLDGQAICPASTFAAAHLGIRTVYQEINLATNLSVAENVCLGQFDARRVGLDWKGMIRLGEESVAKLGLELDVRRPLSDFSVAIQQMIAIARAIAVTPKVLILDEPTSSLDSAEVDQVFRVMRKLKDLGLGIVFVSHFLDQIYAVSDRITVLRNGKLVATSPISEMGPQDLVRHMIGHSPSEETPIEREPTASSVKPEPIIRAKSLSRRMSVDSVDLSVGPGEVLGLAGLLGSGRTETLRLLFGVDAKDGGDLEFNGKPLTRWNCRKAIRAGMGFCTEDRKVSGIIPELSVRENILLVLQARRGILGPLPKRQQQELALQLVKKLRIATTDVEKPIQFLSGGNQQKCLLARWLVIEPKLLLLDEPTRGIDVGAKAEILQLIVELRKQGMALIIADSELSELLRVCTSTAVMRDRKILQTLPTSELTEERVMALMAEGNV